MRVLVCGGRDFTDTKLLYFALDQLASFYEIDCIIEGDARGADRMAGYWAKKNRVDLELYPITKEDWSKHGLGAGPIRNQYMLEKGRPDLVLAFRGGNGTADMVRRARQAGLEVKEIS